MHCLLHTTDSCLCMDTPVVTFTTVYYRIHTPEFCFHAPSFSSMKISEAEWFYHKLLICTPQNGTAEPDDDSNIWPYACMVHKLIQFPVLNLGLDHYASELLTLLKMCCYYNITMCHYWDTLVK